MWPSSRRTTLCQGKWDNGGRRVGIFVNVSPVSNCGRQVNQGFVKICWLKA
jgi:hypothetical protein